jgi:putative CocE/NonD family hydrolase
VAAVALIVSILGGWSTTPAGAAGGAQYKVPPATSGTINACDTPITLSDGVRLFADRVSPDKAGRYPTILTVTGYNKSPGPQNSCGASDSLFATHGYNRLTVDDRGSGNSEGSWDSWGARMQQDYKELLDWIVKQPWSDGTVGMTGGSYMGITSFLVAETGHPAVKAIWADVPMADAYRDVTLHGGSINAAFIPLWLGLVGGLGAIPASWTFSDPGTALVTEATHLAGVAGFQGDAVSNFATDGDLAYDGPFYQLRSPETKAATLTVPVAWTGGWFDLFQRGEARLYNALKSLGPDKKKWFMSPTYHTAGNSHWDELGIGSKDAVVLAWFDHWLKRADNGVEKLPSINLWQMGAERWNRPTAWPVPSTAWTTYHLGGGPSGSASSLNDGTLATTPSAPGSDMLPVLPLLGFCSRSLTQWSAGLVLGGSDCETDDRVAEATALTYTTTPLAADVEVTGPITATIWGTLNRPEANLAAIVSDVAPDGRSTQVTGGWLNASHRAVDAARSIAIGDRTVIPFHPFTKAAQKAVPSGEPQRYDIEVFPTAQTFKAGHRIRLMISTGDAHALAPAPVALNTVGAVFTVLRDSAHPSTLLLPITTASAGAGSSLAVKGATATANDGRQTLPATGRDGTVALAGVAAAIGLLAVRRGARRPGAAV